MQKTREMKKNKKGQEREFVADFYGNWILMARKTNSIVAQMTMPSRIKTSD